MAAATACAQVLSLLRSRAGMTTPRSIAARRRPETRSSRATMSATIQAGKAPVPTTMISIASTSTLSATGSSIEPSADVCPCRRASQPSIWSVAMAAANTAVAQ